MQTYQKDPDALLDYAVDWTAALASGDTISAVAWTLPAGITKTDESHTSAVATVWISGGTHGVDYVVTCDVQTAQGRRDQRSFTLQVRDQ